MSSHFQIERIEHMVSLFEDNPDLFNQNLIPEIKAKGESRVVATLPLNNHETYGETILFINEKYKEDGTIEEYRYGWELSQRLKKIGKSSRHIFAFDKQKHPEPPHNVDTDPYHHHHVPGDIKPRTETIVETLEDVVSILKDYIVGQKEYNESHHFL
ncbi:toxin-antitoxin system TumE family protein [Bacillus cereus group sp. TH152-1LC]|uniref:toxin-antitoxin system TumE family protein n=1 Tax=Bacillus cereus group sp. TH152-1LC TaxID=3018060 RepID=UPI0022E4EA8F|nr:DUF6516 family protein [Bacillus cereus group sp. TH152-1LC]MDA1675542.1 DUF6516 family protein [Bacillus cereus group sp. TH152-1LC]